MLHTNLDVMRARTTAYLPKTTTVEGIVMRGSARTVQFKNRPNFFQRLFAVLLGSSRPRKSSRPITARQPSLSGR